MNDIKAFEIDSLQRIPELVNSLPHSMPEGVRPSAAGHGLCRLGRAQSLQATLSRMHPVQFRELLSNARKLG
jgi:hypothetical protein